MKNYEEYGTYKKPTWAPPAWLFAPVWSVLYLLIAVSFGYVGYLYLNNAITLAVALPFILNLIFNFAFTPIQFGLKNFTLATLDILFVLVTLVWALVVIYPYVSWVTFANLPYLLWVSFATVLQITVMSLNKRG